MSMSNAGLGSTAATMLTATVTDMGRIMRTAFLVPMGNPHRKDCDWGAPICQVGGPGVGKSDGAAAGASALGLPFEVIYGSSIEPPDVGGAIVADGLGGANRTSVMPALKRLIRDEIGVLFLDEFGDAAPAVQASMQGLVLTKRSGEDVIPPRVRLAMAANPPSLGGWEFRPQMANRIVHVQVIHPTPEDYAEWLLTGQSKPLKKLEDGEELVRRNWDANRAAVTGLIGQFLVKHRNFLYQLPEEGDPNRGGAWPSPRSWFMAARILTTCHCLGDVPAEDEDLFIYGCVGAEAAEQFQTWQRKMDLPSMMEILTGKWKPDGQKRIDQAYVAYNSFSTWFAGLTEAQQKEYALPFWETVARSEEAGLVDLTTMLVALGSNKVRATTFGPDVQKVANPVITRIGTSGMVQFGKP